MFLNFCLLISICNLLSPTYASKAPYFKRCTANDRERCPSEVEADIDMSYLAEGIPELGIPAAEPMFFKNITMDQGHFKLHLNTMKVVGVKKCKITKFLKDPSALTLTISFDCPFEATGKYTYYGTLSIFEIKNDGKFKIETESSKTTITYKMEKYDADNGKSYWKLLSYDYNLEPVDKLHIDLDNLFSGSIGNAQTYLNLFDKNWWTSTVQVGNPMADAIHSHFYEVLKEFYLNVPIDELECSE